MSVEELAEAARALEEEGKAVESANAQADVEATNAEAEQAEQELTLEDLYQMEVESAEDRQKAERELLLPAGTYTTIPPFTPTINKDKFGRPIARLWGTVQFGDVKGKIGYRLSSVRLSLEQHYQSITSFGDVADEDKAKARAAKPDSAYKNWLLAAKAYKAAYGEEPASFGSVVEYLRDYPHRLRVIQTSNGQNAVVSISPVRE